ncbi:hypothetical protein [Frigoribacterium sp. MCBA15_019]|uniref:hypothetical protein n=1 Tax=Frigoribacterium sp. MCBA15_019 TaxID=1898745 RepID=UPI00115FD3F1|nr:hypothetical protein [Frigoribacterium sp. MCBA15_019]
MTDLELGWLIGVIETDGAIYPETRGFPGEHDRPRRVALEVENADEAMMERVASYLQTAPPRRLEQHPNAAGNWTKATFRVRLRGERAAKIYRQLLPHFMPVTVERVTSTFARASVPI